VSDRASCRRTIPRPISVILSAVRRPLNGVEGPRVRRGRHEPLLTFSPHNGRSAAPSIHRLGYEWRTLLVSVLLLLFFPLSIFAQQSRSRFDDHIQAFVRNGDFSGSVLIGKSGHVVFQKSYGMANYEWSIPNAEKTKFHIASVTKTFTAAAIVMLEQQGKLKLNDPLSKYIPGYLNGDRITIEQMLAHSSGLPDYYSLPEYSTKKYQRVTLADLIEWVKTKPLDFLPGSKNSYSNTGYGFLAYIIEQVSGKPYDRFIGDEILRPAGMKDTGTLRDEALISARADGYQPALGNPGLRNAPFYEKTILTGSGSLYSTTDDLYAWYRAIEAGRFFDIHKLSYPYGWGARETKSKHKYIEQSGRDPGFASHITVFPDDDLVVIVLGNLEDAAVNVMADDLGALALGENPQPPATRPRTIVPIAHAQDYGGRYEVNPTFLIDVRAEGSDLYLRGTGGDYLPLEPLAKDSYFYRQLYVKVGFQRDKAGKIETLLWNGDYPCKKVSDKPQP
jgi:CubicO group peptidase (beta-lactamase class C family)